MMLSGVRVIALIALIIRAIGAPFLATHLERPNTPKDATGVVRMDKAVRLEPASCPLDPFEFADAHEQPRAYFRRLGGYFGSNVFCEEEVEFNLSVIRIS